MVHELWKVCLDLTMFVATQKVCQSRVRHDVKNYIMMSNSMLKLKSMGRTSQYHKLRKGRCDVKKYVMKYVLTKSMYKIKYMSTSRSTS